jgi:hypothetical protein
MNPVHDKTVEGDYGNAAAFFLERYYQCYRVQSRTVEALLPLAVHCILMGAEISGNVEGLELAVCTRERCEYIKDLGGLEKFSSQLDSEIARQLGCT